MTLPTVSQIVPAPINYSGNPYLSSYETAVVVSLIRSVKPRIVIEFGCQLGRTAKTVLDNVPGIVRYIGVDVPFSYKPKLKQQSDEIPGTPGLYASGDTRFWLLRPNNGTLDLLPTDLEPCDAVFIDGDHSEYVVRHDSLLARLLVRPGGILIWHDYDNPAVEVTPVLDRFCEGGWPIKHVTGTWVAFMKL